MRPLLLLLLLSAFLTIAPPTAAVVPCSRESAGVSGSFVCSSPCDDSHIAFGNKYCLNYFPDGGQCYNDPYDTKEKILSCNDRYGKSESQNHWYVMVGGSNAWGEFKAFVDIMLGLPADTVYNPNVMYPDSDTDVSASAELGFMDFIWDADGTPLRRYAHSLGDENGDYYGLTNQMPNIFNNVPVPAKGAFRASYVSIHFATDFITRFEAIVGVNSDWVKTKPAVDIRFEWSGRWGDSGVDASVHRDNVLYLDNRKKGSEKLDVRSFVFSDSAFECKGMDSASFVSQDAMVSVADSVDFTVSYFSKQVMALEQEQLSNICMTNGHALHPLNSVYIQRAFSIMCAKDDRSGDPFETEIPVCLDMGIYASEETNYQCFDQGSLWMSNIGFQCPHTFLSVPTGQQDDFCAADTIFFTDAEKELPKCEKLPETSPSSRRRLDGSNPSGRGDLGDLETGAGEGKGEETFSAIVYASGTLCFIFVVTMSVLDAKKSWKTNPKNGSYSATTVLSPSGRGLFELLSWSKKTNGDLEINVGAPVLTSTTEELLVKPTLNREHNRQPSFDFDRLNPEGPDIATHDTTHHTDVHVESDGPERSPALKKVNRGSVPPHFDRVIVMGKRMSATALHLPPDVASGSLAPAGESEPALSRSIGTVAGSHSHPPAFDRHAASTSHPARVSAAPLLHVPHDMLHAAPQDPGLSKEAASKPPQKTAEVSVVPDPTTNELLRHYFSIPSDVDPNKFEAINFARFLASVHIVVGHMYQMGALPSGHGFNTFGYTWVPFFFLLSGHILTFVECKRRKKAKATEELPSVLSYVNKRLESMYPTYAVGIVFAIITAWVVKGPNSLQPPLEVLASALLLQSWIPSILEKGLIYLVQCWFLSCLLFYWVMFYHVYDFVQSRSKAGLIFLAAFTSIIIPLAYQLGTISDPYWFSSHKYLRTTQLVDVFTVALKYHPLSYFHIFVLGACVPRLREFFLELSISRFFKPWICLVGYSSLVLIFLCGGVDVPGRMLSFRLGLISSLQVMVLIGLCNKEDLLGRIFCHPLLARFGNYSFSQYVFQFLAYAWFTYSTGSDYSDMRYFLLLFTMSVVVGTAISYVNGKNMNRFTASLVPLLFVYLLLQPYLTTLGELVSSSGAVAVAQPEWWTEEVMKFTVTSDTFLPGPMTDRHIFNPSIYIDGNLKIFAARRGTVTSTYNSWFSQEYLTNKWNTEVIMGNYKRDGRKLLSTSVDIDDFTPCMPPPICNNNGTLVAKVTTAPEDPRIFKYRGELYLSHFSYDHVNITSDRVIVHPDYDFYGDYGSGTRVCVPTDDGLIGRMHITKLADVPVNKCVLNSIKPVKQLGLQFTNYSIVKNWLAFTHTGTSSTGEPNDEEDLYFIHQISPKFIVMKLMEENDNAWRAQIMTINETPDEIIALDEAAVSGALTSKRDFEIVHQGERHTMFVSKERADMWRESSTASASSRREQYSTGTRPTRRLETNYFCDNGFEVFGDRCYNLMRTPASYYDAKTMCQDSGATLVSIKTEETMSFLASIFYSDNDIFWLGADDTENEGVFKWADGSLLSDSFQWWNSGEPNDWDENEDCVQFFKYQGWNDIDCFNTLYPACEKAAYEGTFAPTITPTEPPQWEDKGETTSIHGNVNPVLIPGVDDDGNDASYYMSVFHTVSEEEVLNYASYAFTFCNKAPFQISGVSKRLPLQLTSADCGGRSPFAFVSGLSVDSCNVDDPDQTGLAPSCLVITYGVCDRESRIAYVNIAEFEAEYLTKLRDC